MDSLCTIRHLSTIFERRQSSTIDISWCRRSCHLYRKSPPVRIGFRGKKQKQNAAFFLFWCNIFGQSTTITTGQNFYKNKSRQKINFSATLAAWKLKELLTLGRRPDRLQPWIFCQHSSSPIYVKSLHSVFAITYCLWHEYVKERAQIRATAAQVSTVN